MYTALKSTQNKLTCYHCGDYCKDDSIHLEEKNFCCDGCKLVFELLSENNLCTYYDLEKNPGVSQKIKINPQKFDFLDDEKNCNKLIHFKKGNINHVSFYLPQMHCSSCIWLLEHLNKLNTGIVESRTNFLEKRISIVFNANITKLRTVVELLSKIGYEPHINFDSLQNNTSKPTNKKRILRLGVAGFCFGNIMMLSFPEYFSLGNLSDNEMKSVFGYLNLTLSLPVFFYSSGEFFSSTITSIKQRFLNIDTPIALAILITFARSVYEILTQSGAGYMDSMSGIVFFMLAGRYFQDKTYDSISFERDYKSFFPVSVTKLVDGISKGISVSDIEINDHIKIHNGEIIPVDSLLIKGKAKIDYSFVTGESDPVNVYPGEMIYAGGKQTQEAIEVKVVKVVSQSYLTQLWNRDIFKENKEKHKSFVHAISKYFTIALFIVAFTSFAFWSYYDPTKALDALTSVLIVACPCSLLLSSTFTNGNIVRLLGKKGYYLKNNVVLETIAEANHIVFDKTGTITLTGENEINYFGDTLTLQQKLEIASICSQSNHPLSIGICKELNQTTDGCIITHYEEIPGAGISAIVNNTSYKIGSIYFCYHEKENEQTNETRVYVLANNKHIGYFTFKNKFRNGLKELIQELKKDHSITVLSGDNDGERANINKIFGAETNAIFNQTPSQKLEYIKRIQQGGQKVIMIGDGLNDAGALKQSDAGIAISDNKNNFTPGCDAIVSGTNFQNLGRFIKYARSAKRIIVTSFIISILYNFIGLYFATQALLEPVIAAILMPASSISIVLYTTIASTVSAKINKV